jgi:YidC/Oxa1 family membrane protein insertase
MLSLLFSVVPNWPLVLILIGIGSRLLLAPLQQVALVQQQRLAKAKPELDELLHRHSKESFADTVQASRRVKREHGVRESWLLIATFAQLPIFIWLYHAIRSEAALQTVRVAWMPSLAAPDPLFILPLIAAAVAYWALRGPKSLKLSPWFQSALTFAFVFALPSGVAIYSIAAQVTQGILQRTFVR